MYEISLFYACLDNFFFTGKQENRLRTYPIPTPFIFLIQYAVSLRNMLN